MAGENERIHQLIPSLSGRALDLPSAIDGFLLSIELENRTPDTLTFYRGMLNRFLWFAEQNAFPENLGDISKAHIELFLWYLKKNSNPWGKIVER